MSNRRLGGDPMIEFKAECGHTVRARDEDAGGVVRCSYCGRNAAVPDNAASDLDYLFRELEETGEKDRTYRKPKKKRRKERTPIVGGGFDPFAVVLKLCYVAALIIIVWVVTQKAVMPFLRGEKPSPLFGESAKKSGENPAAMRPPSSSTRRMGLITGPRVTGLYVSSIPTGAMAYILDVARAPTTGCIFRLPGVRQVRTDGAVSHLPDGEYLVEVRLPWHDKRLSAYPNYWDFRRSLENATDAERRRLVEEYFIPDEAVDAFVDETEEQIYLVRQYRASILRDQSRGVQALFLPRIPRTDGPGFAIEPLVARYAPTGKRYAFDEEQVYNELAYYGVLVADRPLVVEALHRMGVISYVTPDGATRLFRIGINDGEFRRRVVRQPK